MKMAIADPPYLGRAIRWYGQNGRGNRRGLGRADQNDHAGEWDTPERHQRLVRELNENFEAWAVALTVHSLDVYLAEVSLSPSSGYRIGAWIKERPVPSGSRITTAWEPVIFRIPAERRNRASGVSVLDYVIASPLSSGFTGAKPPKWTRWVLDVLGYQEGDDVVDLFPGSGAVTKELQQTVLTFSGNKLT